MWALWSLFSIRWFVVDGNMPQKYGPHFTIVVIRLERVQRSFTRYLSLKTFTYLSTHKIRLARFNMLTLQSRRSLMDMTFFHKLLHNDVNLDWLHHIIFRVAPFLSRNTFLFTPSPPTFRTDIGKHVAH